MSIKKTSSYASNASTLTLDSAILKGWNLFAKHHFTSSPIFIQTQTFLWLFDSFWHSHNLTYNQQGHSFEKKRGRNRKKIFLWIQSNLLKQLHLFSSETVSVRGYDSFSWSLFKVSYHDITRQMSKCLHAVKDGLSGKKPQAGDYQALKHICTPAQQRPHEHSVWWRDKNHTGVKEALRAPNMLSGIIVGVITVCLCQLCLFKMGYEVSIEEMLIWDLGSENHDDRAKRLSFSSPNLKWLCPM